MSKKISKVKCNLMQAEIYARNAEFCKACPTQPKKYVELRNIQTKNGFEQQRVLVDYPITPEYVKSFAQSADYHNDPATAMAMTPRGQNLGDITNLQEVLSKDMESARNLYANLKQVFETAQKQATATPAENIDKESVNNG